jgi:hypothetical protein
MFPLDLLRVALAWLVLIRIDMTCVRTPIVRIIACDAKRLSQGFELQKQLWSESHVLKGRSICDSRWVSRPAHRCSKTGLEVG